MSAAVLVGVSGPGQTIPGGSLVRATFEKDGALSGGLFTSPNEAYRSLQSRLPQMQLGYVASPFVETPGSSTLTIDLRTALTAILPAGNLASAYNEAAQEADFSLVRLQLLGVKTDAGQAASSGETAAQAAANRDGVTKSTDAQPTWWQKTLSAFGLVGDWTLSLVKWVAIILLVVLAFWLFH